MVERTWTAHLPSSGIYPAYPPHLHSTVSLPNWNVGTLQLLPCHPPWLSFQLMSTSPFHHQFVVVPTSTTGWSQTLVAPWLFEPLTFICFIPGHESFTCWPLIPA